jgi:hypothetical protein
MTSHQSHRTGDINFFSACMAIGIAPCFPEPAEILQNDDGRDYLSFSLNWTSECGQHDTKAMSRAWSYPAEFARECQNHPFSALMEFSKFSRGAKTKDDWTEKAAAFLSVSRDSIRKALKDVSTLEATAPESPLTYIVCFIANRFAAIQWAKTSIPKTVANKGPSIVLMDGNLPIRKQRHLLSFL